MSEHGFPRLDILPEAQRVLVPQLGATADLGFVLYGGTAIALHLGHRQSVDFDFFSESPLDVRRLVDTLSPPGDATVLQSDRDTYTVLLPSLGNTVKVSFFGGISFGRVGVAERLPGADLRVASLDDLIATKLKVLMQRVEPKDYIDIAAIVAHGVSLNAGLGTAELFFGKTFSAADCLRALEYFEDPHLSTIDETTRTTLHEAVRRVVNDGRIVTPRRVSTSLV